MQQHDYDKILYRLMSILGRLNDGEILYKDDLAKYMDFEAIKVSLL